MDDLTRLFVWIFGRFVGSADEEEGQGPGPEPEPAHPYAKPRVVGDPRQLPCRSPPNRPA